MRPWSQQESDYLMANYGRMPLKEIARALDRSIPSLNGHLKKLGIRSAKAPNWKPEEIRFLRENWGRLSPPNLARRLGRSVNAIMVKCKRLKLGPAQDKSQFTKSEICELLGVDHRKVKRWVDHGLLKTTVAPTARERGKSRNILQVKPHNLVDFLRNNPDQWDTRRAGDILRAVNAKELLAHKVKIQRTEYVVQRRRIPELLMPAFVKFVADVAEQASDRIGRSQEPEWLKKKRLHDSKRYLPREGFRWTQEEDKMLRELFRKGDLTCRQIAELMGRSGAAVRHRLTRIDVWETGRKAV